MSRHILDRAEGASDTKPAQFITRDREAMPHPSTRALQRRPRVAAQGGQRLSVYARIERESRD